MDSVKSATSTIDRIPTSRSDDDNASSIERLPYVSEGAFKAKHTKPKECRDDWGLARKVCAVVLEAKLPGGSIVIFDIAISTVIVVNMVAMVFEIDASADCVTKGQDICESFWVSFGESFVFMSVYIVELAIRVFTYRCAFFADYSNLVDIIVVSVGILDTALTSMEASGVELLRMVRLARLVRSARILKRSPTLMNMILGFMGAMRAMLSGILLLLCMLVAWAMVFVQMVHPYNVRLDHDNKLCNVAFSSVWHASLVLFQTLVAGDSWGVCALPIIEEMPFTYLFFALSLVTVQLGFMNLVLAIIVDQAAEARELSKEERVHRKRRDDADNLQRWRDTMEELDEDSSGYLSKDEFVNGYDKPHVRQTLETMYITLEDVKQLFHYLDRDDSGTVEYHEFVDQFYRAQCQDPHIYMMTMKLQLDKMYDKINAVCGDELDSRLRALGDDLRSALLDSALEAARREVANEVPPPPGDDARPPGGDVEARGPILRRCAPEVRHLCEPPAQASAHLEPSAKERAGNPTGKAESSASFQSSSQRSGPPLRSAAALPATPRGSQRSPRSSSRSHSCSCGAQNVKLQVPQLSDVPARRPSQLPSARF